MKHLKILLTSLMILSFLAACAPEVMVINTQYILTTAMHEGKFVYLGVDGDINGVVNPVLHANPGERINIMLINSGEGTHDIVFPHINVQSDAISKQGETTSITFIAPKNNVALEYHDSGYEKIGMKGVLLVGEVVAGQAEPVMAEISAPAASGVTVEYALESGLMEGKMVFIGKGGEIDGQMNPDLKANLGDTVKITLFSGEGAAHNFYLDEFGAQSADVVGQENSVSLEFVVDQEGTFTYYCAIAGHRQAGMEGKFIAGSGVASAASQTQSTSYTGSGESAPVVAAGAADPNAVDITRDPSDLPGPLPKRGPEKLVVNLETVELVGKLADGTTYKFWTFNGKIPGPFIRVQVGDTVEVHLKNLPDSMMAHSVDFHATTGPGGGAVATQTQPGGDTMFTFKALNPGVYVYHCATPMVAQHITNGMYGLILVEPEGGLPPVDREFYVMQGELYTAQPFGTTGALTEDTTKLLNENPEYFVFNGASMALASEEHMLRAKVGETVRIYFGVGGPNFTSSFHVIGEIFDRVFDQASLTANPLTDVQTTLVPPGGATMVEFTVEVPGRYILVDHALSRLQRGLAGFLMVEGEPNLSVFDGEATEGSGH
ncbi:MAG: nitrite reductase, copper-containing [Chloroflexi bacterium HGW-Chloroflexi-6]|nr:MAG: nitrite reductase, copper-containing [Chloroflexi bacterium HGW-Chloroflexi-6]